MSINTMSSDDFRALADVLFPDVKQTPSDIEAKYPPRDLPEGAWVSRFAPSPTGFIHIGTLFAGLLNKMLTANGGVYILRVEDTDQNREVERGTEQIVEAIERVNLLPDEGFRTSDPLTQVGDYGSYLQSERLDLYQIYAKDMVARGNAYPCFLTSEELDEIREQQVKQNIRAGVYGEWARSRNLSLDDIKARIAKGDEYVIRIKAPAASDDKVTVIDLIRESLELPVNELDSVMLKSDKFPTYNFAHIIDDHLMRCNIVLRGDEYIPSLPLHIQILEALALPVPMYAHFAPIAKMDGDSRRKLSKRKDDEAAILYYYEKGYPQDAILEYLLNLMNSSFEEWRTENPDSPYIEFPFDINKMGRASSLFDMEKLTSVAKEIIAKYKAEDVFQNILDWAERYDTDAATLLKQDEAYSIAVFGIERGGEKPRKDLAKWDEWQQYYGMLFDTIFETNIPAGYADAPDLKQADMLALLDFLIEITPATITEDKNAWIQRMRDYAADNGYAKRPKDYQKDPDAYKGVFGDIMMAYRVALTGKTQTPDLYEMVMAMGAERAIARFQKARDHFAG
ncbi:MAG: glutamate--tRNA ligase family protein [Phototrophicaceae bacterium]